MLSYLHEKSFQGPNSGHRRISGLPGRSSQRSSQGQWTVRSGQDIWSRSAIDRLSSAQSTKRSSLIHGGRTRFIVSWPITQWERRFLKSGSLVRFQLGQPAIIRGGLAMKIYLSTGKLRRPWRFRLFRDRCGIEIWLSRFYIYFGY